MRRGLKDNGSRAFPVDVYLALTRHSLSWGSSYPELITVMNLYSMVKRVLLALILFGLMASVLPSRGQLVNLGGGSRFLVGEHLEQAAACCVASAFR